MCLIGRPRMAKLTTILLMIISSFFYPTEIDAEEFRPTVLNDYMVHPEKDSGYFQGWNLYFYNEEYFITVNMVVSNIGPGTMNNGVNIIVLQKDKKPIFIEKEFSGSDFTYAKDNFNIRLYNNTLEKHDNQFILNAEIKRLHIYLIFIPANKGVTISGGKTSLGSGKYLKADIPFSDGKAYGVIINNQNKREIYGRGSMEHLITNQEVYKFSTNWFVMKTFTKDGFSIISGGFNGNKNYAEKFFKTVALISPSGKILYSGKGIDNTILHSEFDKIISYNLNLSERVYFGTDKKCYLDIINIKPFSKINILSNISILLRTFIKVFFAKPYQIYSTVKSDFNCPTVERTIEKGENPFQGAGWHNYFLINPE